MRYHNITKDDQKNGDGLRVVLWVSGCSHNCPDCQNPQTHSHHSGIPFREADKQELFEALDHDYISGITLSGGDPLFDRNCVDIHNLLVDIKNLFPTKTVWCYTGYTYEEIMSEDINEYENPVRSGSKVVRKNIVKNYVDVLIDGEYIREMRNIDLKWRGSWNQRVIDVKKSIEKGEIVLHCD